MLFANRDRDLQVFTRPGRPQTKKGYTGKYPLDWNPFYKGTEDVWEGCQSYSIRQYRFQYCSSSRWITICNRSSELKVKVETTVKHPYPEILGWCILLRIPFGWAIIRKSGRRRRDTILFQAPHESLVHPFGVVSGTHRTRFVVHRMWISVLRTKRESGPHFQRLANVYRWRFQFVHRFSRI